MPGVVWSPCAAQEYFVHTVVPMYCSGVLCAYLVWSPCAVQEHFVHWARTAFQLFGSRVRMWITFNEANAFCATGLIFGFWVPGKLCRFGLCGRALFNMYQCHIAAYNAIKAMPGGKQALVGIVHQHVKFNVARPKVSHSMHWP
jgi:beta-glucosidase/6-phospho-beta-glucosidase/beta-galactosidase